MVMTAWLLPIFGIVIIGVIIELISRDSKIGRFIRAVYSFFILFVIVQPIPELLNEKISFFEADGISVNGELLNEINASAVTAREKQTRQLLQNLGYSDCLVSLNSGCIFINSGTELNTRDITQIKQAVASMLSITVEDVFVL